MIHVHFPAAFVTCARVQPCHVRLTAPRWDARANSCGLDLYQTEPRLRWMGSRSATIPAEERATIGRALSEWGDGGWGDLVQHGKQVSGAFSDELVEAAARLITQWETWPSPSWITWVPSLRHPELVAGFAQRLSTRLGWPAVPVVVKERTTLPQKVMQNSAQQLANVDGAFAVRGRVPNGPCLLVDDIVDSRWTVTVIAALLRRAGCPAVYPFALALAAGR
jgi:ATP-dependent DNA helicase RecQ